MFRCYWCVALDLLCWFYGVTLEDLLVLRGCAWLLTGYVLRSYDVICPEGCLRKGCLDSDTATEENVASQGVSI